MPKARWIQRGHGGRVLIPWIPISVVSVLVVMALAAWKLIGAFL